MSLLQSPVLIAAVAGPMPPTPLLAGLLLRRGLRRAIEDVEFAVLERVSWFNCHRLLEPIGNIPQVEFEENYHLAQKTPAGAD